MKGIEKLRAESPSQVVIIDDTPSDFPGKDFPHPDASDDSRPGTPDSQNMDCFDPLTEKGGIGHIRNLGLTPLGIARQNESFGWLFFQKHGIYDFGMNPSHLPMMASNIDVSMALPEISRRLLMPKTTASDDLVGMLRPFAQRMREMLV